MHPKHLLAKYNLEPKRSLGQNFLFDPHVLKRIVDAAEISAVDQVLEIGPGLGSLTKQLARRAGRVVAVELDGRFLPILKDELAENDHVQLVHGDILEQNLDDLFQGSYKVVANVPYYITGSILRHLLSSVNKPEIMVLTVQKEVAQRVTAVPPHMSLLSVSVQYYGQVQILFTIKAGAFWPRPDVDSAVVRIDINSHAAAELAQEQEFFRIARAGFSQKRKQLQKNLRQLGLSKAEIAAALKKVDIDGSRRAETLSLREWRMLSSVLNQD